MRKTAEKTKTHERYPDHSNSDLCKHYGRSTSTIGYWLAAGMPGKVKGRYDYAAIDKWLLEMGPLRLQHAEQQQELDLSGGSGSPSLERKRAAEAEHAELDLAERKKQLIASDKLKPLLSRWHTIIGRAGEKLGQQVGPRAADILNKALRECKRLIDDELDPGTNSDIGPTPGAFVDAEHGASQDHAANVPVG